MFDPSSCEQIALLHNDNNDHEQHEDRGEYHDTMGMKEPIEEMRRIDRQWDLVEGWKEVKEESGSDRSYSRQIDHQSAWRNVKGNVGE